MKSTLYLLKNTPEDVWAISVGDPWARERLTSLTPDTLDRLSRFQVLIAYSDQLHQFVQRVPSLAWELLEYAQEPLEIIYPERKSTVGDDLDAPSICVRWVQHPKVSAFLKKTGPVWSTHTLLHDAKHCPPHSVIECYERKYPYSAVKTIRIAADSTFTFLR